MFRSLQNQLQEVQTNLGILLQQSLDAPPESAAASAAELETALRDVNRKLSSLASCTSPFRQSASARPDLHLELDRQRLQTLLDHIPSVAVVYDENDIVLYANAYAVELLGFHPEQMPRSAVFERLILRDEQGNPIPLEEMPASQAARGEQVRAVRMELTNAQGKVFHVKASALQVMVDGQPAGVVSVWNDYSEHRRSEEALEAAHTAMINEKNRLLSVLEALPSGVVIYNRFGGIIQANRGYEEIWGSPLPPADSVRDYAAYKAWWVENGQPLQPEEWASAQAVQKGETILNQFLDIQRFDGQHAYVLNSGAPIFDAEGKIAGSAVSIRDITDRVKAEQALRESEERFRVALSSLPMMVFTLDTNLRYTWVYQPPMGIAPQEFLGKCDEEISDRTPPAYTALKQEVVHSGQGARTEILMNFGAEEKMFLVSLEPLRNAHGRITGLIGTALDMTEQRRMQVEHQQAISHMEMQRRLLEQRERERQEIAREIHDGPMQTIISRLYALHAARDDAQDEDIRQALEQTAIGLRSAVQELRNVVNELRPPVLLKFGLARAIQIHSEDFRGQYPHLRLELDLHENGSLFPEDISLALYRIYQECLNNVVRHADANTIWVRYIPEQQHMCLEIRDDGKGFDMPDNWGEMTRDSHFGIAGMRERVEAIGGRLELVSQPGQGTQVQVVVPVHGI